MGRVSECGQRIESCTKWGKDARRKCVEERDKGYSACRQERDEGYRRCCGWVPCRWLCKAWVWVSHVVCIAWTWVSHIVCALWRTIVQLVCYAWTVVTFGPCLISPKAARVIDRIILGVVEAVASVVGVAVGAAGGISYAIRHPVQTVGTVIDWFRGCPDVAGARKADMLVISHHGHTRLYAENTVQGCLEALHNGADSIEIDLCVTSDREVVLWHDWTPDSVIALARQVGPGLWKHAAYGPRCPPVGSRWRRPTDELTLRELREHYGYQNVQDPTDRLRDDLTTGGRRDVTIPTLEEFVRALVPVRDKLRLLCLDIKLPAEGAGHAAMLTDEIQALLTPPPRYAVIVMVPSISVLKAMKARSDERSYGLAFSWDVEYPAGPIVNPLRYSAINHAVDRDLHLTAASVGRPVLFFFPWKTYKRTLRYDVRRWNAVNANPGAENAGRRIDHLIPWTVNDEDELRCLVQMNVSGILTDETERLARILGR